MILDGDGIKENRVKDRRCLAAMALRAACSGIRITDNSRTALATEIVEPCHATEDRITQATGILRESGEKPNIAAAACEFRVTARLQARWNGRKAKGDIIPGNRRRQEYQELVVCSYLDRYHVILEWLHEFKHICDEYGIQACVIHNFGFCIGVGKYRKTYSTVCSPSAATQIETVTVVEAINGDGFVLPPMVIVSGIIHLKLWFDSCLTSV